MTRIRPILATIAVIALAAASTLWGCSARYRVQTYQPGTYIVTQPQPVVVAQPQPVVVTQPAPVVVQRPPTVYVTQPRIYIRPQTPVMTPARVYMTPIQYNPVSSWSGYQCVPGTSRSCGGTYCGSGGSQYCNADGMSWGPCIEDRGGWVE
jgi:hypothetical protein